MKCMLLLLLSGFACGQFIRFDDTFEDDSRENRFRPRPRTSFNRFDDSDEDGFRLSRHRSSFRDSDESFFDRNRFDDSDERFFGTNRNSFVRTNTFRNPSFRTQNTFNRNPNVFRPALRIDSVEDVFNDLFDEDLDDRIKAQNTLTRLGVSPNSFFRSSAPSTNRGFTSFNTRLGSNHINSDATKATPRPNHFSRNQNALNHFSVPRHSTPTPTVNRFNNGFSFGTTVGNNRFDTNRNQFSGSRGVPLSNTFADQSRSSTNFNSQASNRFDFSGKRSTPSSLNSLTSSGTSKRSSGFRSPSGFNWPGGNGYYVSMSTGNSEPVTYFVKYDD